MSAAAEITVLAQWQPKPEALDEVLSIVAEMRSRSLEEPGCLQYEAYQQLGAPGRLLLVERYRDAAALEAHKQSEHYQQLVAGRAIGLLAQREVDLLRS
ncbi:putative quinol monooxygenase [Pseudoduganella sp. OTU4001]|uniref:putative quinol monooxygenase n=1 Tax=Pseudoduganella sp. OTU4001 TaxID=3043854 RepID=UPI00313C7881